MTASELFLQAGLLHLPPSFAEKKFSAWEPGAPPLIKVCNLHPIYLQRITFSDNSQVLSEFATV